MAQRKSGNPSSDTTTDDLGNKTFPSIIDIKRKLPSHCFQSTLSLSFFYAFRDLLIIGTLYGVTVTIWRFFPPLLGIVCSPVYWFLQGIMFMAVFVIGHDCGHGSFSNNELLNDIVGTVLHTFVMTPYYSWKLSHRAHHKNTGNIDKDEVFFPLRQNKNSGRSFIPGFGLGFGWFLYLLSGFKHRATHHFNPLEPIYSRHVLGVSLSLSVFTVWAAILYSFSQLVGFGHMMYYYAMPVFVFASILVVVTFLHHTEEHVPWYADTEWDNVRGQVSSIDRDYGWFHGVIHNIGTHQIHHLFPRIPHYHLEEATTHFRKAFPDIVHVRRDPIIPSFIRMFIKYCNQCEIEEETKIHIYT